MTCKCFSTTQAFFWIISVFMYLSTAPLKCWTVAEEGKPWERKINATRNISKAQTDLMRAYILTGARWETFIFLLWQKSISSQCTRVEWNSENQLTKSTDSC